MAGPVSLILNLILKTLCGIAIQGKAMKFYFGPFFPENYII